MTAGLAQMVEQRFCKAKVAGSIPAAGAIAFRDMRMDVNAIAYQRRMAQMHMGRSTMPPVQVSLGDIQDIDAYARSLRGSRDH